MAEIFEERYTEIGVITRTARERRQSSKNIITVMTIICKKPVERVSIIVWIDVPI
jgi:hypothetical protein